MIFLDSFLRMEDKMDDSNSKDGKITAYAHWVIRWRFLVLFISIAIALAVASGGKNLSFSTDYRVFFSKTNPFLEAYENMQKVYTKSDTVLIVLAPQDGNVFSNSFLSALEQLTLDSWQIPHSFRVDSITNFQHIRADGDELIVEDLISNVSQLTAEQLEAIKGIALNEPLLLNQLITTKTNVTGVAISVRLPDDDQESQLAVSNIAAHVRELKAKFQETYPGIDVYLTGSLLLANAFPEISQRDMSTLIPLMYLIILLMMGFILRSFSATFATSIVIIFSTMTAMGAGGWMGVKLNAVSASVPTIVLTLAVADSIHILLSMLRFMREGQTRNEALIESLRINFMPVVLTSITTSIGFLGLNFSDAPPFHDLGNMTAIGVMAALFYSLMLLPALMSMLPIKVGPLKSKRFSMETLAEWVITYNTRILYGTATLVVLLTAMIPRLTLNDNFIEYFDKGFAFRDDSDFTLENLTGIYTIEFSLGSGEPSGINDPAYMKKVDEFSTWLREQPEVLNVNVLSDTIKRLNKSMNADDPSFYKLPEQRELTAQYLLLYEMSLPLGLDLNNQINVDKSATRVIATLDNLPTARLQEMKSRFETWLRQNAPSSMFVEGTSMAMMFTYITRTNARGLIKGTAISLFFITLTLIVTLRSVKFGLLSIIPNVIPIVLAYGVWSLVNGEVGIATATIGTITLGIVVDDTVHFLSKYLRARQEQGLQTEDAIRYAFSFVGSAMLATTVILTIGFGILSQSLFKMNSQMGILTMITIIIALIIDFLFFPAILIKLSAKKE
ncbi:MAG: RND transporter, partial [SAR324 cluster bacterium]